ncbi:SEL1-like repeat protein [Pseudoalteromonas gelatinilytica]
MSGHAFVRQGIKPFLIVVLLFVIYIYFSREAAIFVTNSESSNDTKATQHVEAQASIPATKPAASLLAEESAEQGSEVNDSRELIIKNALKWRFDGVLIDHLTELKQRAEQGDAEASYLIAQNLKYCFNAPLDVEALEATLTESYEFSDAGDTQNRVLEKYEYCQGVDLATRRSFYRYLVMAAENGSAYAQQTFAGLTPEFYMKSQFPEKLSRAEFIKNRDNFKERKTVFLEQAAKQGSEQALMSLASMYYSEQVGEHSAAKAYAINRLIMEITQNNDVYNRYAWFEQRQYPTLSDEELSIANNLFEQWLLQIKQNGTLYPKN